MAKVIIDVPRILKLEITKELKSVVQDPKILAEVGIFAKERIVQSARLGKSMANSKKDRPLPDLSESYKARRKSNPSGVDAEFFQPKKKRSNLTFTGQLLRSIVAKIIKTGGLEGRVVVFPKGRRKDGERNIQIIRWLTQLNKDYEIFALSEAAQKQIKKIVTRGLRRKLKELKRKP